MNSACVKCGAESSAASPAATIAGAAPVVCAACGHAYSPHSTPAPLVDGGLVNFSISTLASICIHTALLIGCALVTWGAASSLDSGDEGIEVAIASLTTEDLERRPDERLETSEVATSHRESEQLESVDLLVEGPPASNGEVGIDALGILAPSGAGGSQMERIEAVTGGGGALDGEATFMGVQAQGRRFCIIADRSGSMFGTKFERLKKEILATLDDMRSHTRVQMVLFNTRALAYPKSEWLHPRDERDEMEVWLNGLVADGDTYPTPAFVEAFSLEPLPDAIFFMTDGQFDPRVVKQILRLNTTAQRVVPVHTITFVDRSAELMMRKIAEDSGGKYRHVNETFKLPWGRR